MMGEGNPQPAFFYNISLETFVAGDHPLRAIRPLIDDRAIRRACRELYSPIGRPSIPPEQTGPGPRRRLPAWGHQRSQAGDGAAVQHGPALVESGPAAVGRLHLQSESGPSL